jgi:hypothetical protein
VLRFRTPVLHSGARTKKITQSRVRRVLDQAVGPRSDYPFLGRASPEPICSKCGSSFSPSGKTAPVCLLHPAEPPDSLPTLATLVEQSHALLPKCHTASLDALRTSHSLTLHVGRLASVARRCASLRSRMQRSAASAVRSWMSAERARGLTISLRCPTQLLQSLIETLNAILHFSQFSLLFLKLT